MKQPLLYMDKPNTCRAVSGDRAAEDEQPQRQQHQAELAHHGNNELADVLARVMLNAEIRLAL